MDVLRPHFPLALWQRLLACYLLKETGLTFGNTEGEVKKQNQ